jgi:hypothetical protein
MQMSGLSASLSALLLVIGSCGTASSKTAPPSPAQPSAFAPNSGPSCRLISADQRETCARQAGTNCHLGPALWCYGVKPLPEDVQKHDAAVAAGTIDCECICAEQIQMCGEVP